MVLPSHGLQLLGGQTLMIHVHMTVNSLNTSIGDFNLTQVNYYCSTRWSAHYWLPSILKFVSDQFSGLAREMKYEEYPVQSTFKWLKKADLKKNDKDLFNIFENSKKETALYRTATRIPTGKYTGCKQCQRPKSMSWDGKYYKGKP